MLSVHAVLAWLRPYDRRIMPTLCVIVYKPIKGRVSMEAKVDQYELAISVDLIENLHKHSAKRRLLHDTGLLVVLQCRALLMLKC